MVGMRSYSRGGALVFELCGEHDVSTIPQIEPAIANAIADEPRIVFDLTECTYLDSSIVSMLLRSYKLLSKRMRIVAPASSQARRVLGVTQFDKYVKVFPDVNEALADAAA